MPYATQADMEQRFTVKELIELTDRDATADAVDATVLARALEDADAEVDARLQARYRLPLASVPRLLVKIACDIARWRLYDDRATDQVQRRYEDALKMLDRIGRGEINIGLDASQQATPATAGPAFDTPVRIFSRDKLADYGG